LTTPINVGTDHIRGSVNAPIVIVEYGDYECPYTGMAYLIVKEIMRMKKYKLPFETFLLMRYILMLNNTIQSQKGPE
jgi:hypothetical protein